MKPTTRRAKRGRNWRFGVYANEVTQIAVGQRVRQVSLQRGATDLPFTGDVFPTVDGRARRDDHRRTPRNLLLRHEEQSTSPTDGMAITAYAEINNNLRNSDIPVYSRYELEVKKLFPSESKRAILVIRADLQVTLGDQVAIF